MCTRVHIYIIKEKLETLTSMESYLPTSDLHAASWIFSDGPSKQLGVVKLRYNALKLFFIMSLFYANVPFSASDSHSRKFLKQQDSFAHSASTSVEISKCLYWRYPYWQLFYLFQPVLCFTLGFGDASKWPRFFCQL